VLTCVFLSVQGLHFSVLVKNFAEYGEVESGSDAISAFFGNTVLLYLICSCSSRR